MKHSKTIFRIAALAVSGVFLGVASAATAYDSSLAAPGGSSGASAVYYGTGNGGTNYSWAVATGDGIEIGLQGLTRFVGPISSDDTGNYITTAGESGGIAPWDFAYSIDLQPSGSASGLTLSDINAEITITDANSASEITFNAVGDGTLMLPGAGPVDDAEVNLTSETSDAYTDPLTDPFGAQNAENVGFFNAATSNPFLSGSPFDLDAPDTYTISLALTGPDSLSLTDTITIQTVTPEPSTWLLLAGGIAAAAFFVRRRRTAPELQ
jgi:hypothetical protein